MKNNTEFGAKETIYSVAPPLSKSALQTIASVNLSFSDEVIKSSQAGLEAALRRIESGETSYDQEEDRLLGEWRKLYPNGNPR